MDRILIEKCVNQSAHFEFIDIVESENFHGYMELLVKTKEKFNEINGTYAFLITENSIPLRENYNEDFGGFYTLHPICAKNEYSLKVLVNCYEKIFNERVQTTNGMLSKKPLDADDNKRESLEGLMDRWGSIINESIYNKTKEIEVIALNDANVKVLYDPRGESLGYNKIENIDDLILLSRHEKDLSVVYNIEENATAIYIGDRVGLVNPPEAEEALKERVATNLDNGKDMSNRIKSLKVAVIGAGGTGSMVIETLIKKGVGEISVYDSDVIEISNLHRLSILNLLNIKNIKSSAIKKNAQFDILPDIGISKHEHLTEENLGTLKDMHLIIMCADNVDVRKIVSGYVMDNKIPYIETGIGYDFYGQKYQFTYYGSPIEGMISLDIQENKEDGYGELSNLQMTEGALLMAHKVGLAISKLTGLYHYPNIRDIQSVSNEEKNTKENYEDKA